MPKDYYPAFYEVYVEKFFAPMGGGRGYSSDRVVASGLTEEEAKMIAKGYKEEYKSADAYYVGTRKMKD